jgi:hypothetical protein
LLIPKNSSPEEKMRDVLQPCAKGINCGTPTPIATAHPALTPSDISLVQRTSYQGNLLATYSGKAVPTIDGTSQVAVSGAANSYKGNISFLGQTSTTNWTSLPQPGFSMNIGGVTVSQNSSNFSGTFSHPSFGSAGVWLDQTNWAINVNFSFDTTRTYIMPLSTKKQTPDTFYGNIGIGLGILALGISIVGLFTGITEVAGVLVIGTQAILAIIGLALGLACVLAGIFDGAGCDPTCPQPVEYPRPQATQGDETPQLTYPSAQGLGDGSVPVQVQDDGTGN